MHKLISIFFISLLSLTVSCKNTAQKIVDAVDVQTELNDDGDQLASVDFTFDIGNQSLPFAHFPLPNNYGMVVLSNQDGKAHIGFSLNLSAVADLPSGEATLPNGTAVPLDTYGAGVIEIPIEEINGEVYVSFVNGKAVVGIAVAIEQFDGIGGEMGTVNVFPVFNINAFQISAGIFTSNVPGQSGLAAFVGGGILWDEAIQRRFGYDETQYSPSRVVWGYSLKRRGAKRMRNSLKRFDQTRRVLSPVYR